MLCLMGARAVTITSATGIRLSDARDIYKDINGTASPSGMTPHSLDWYTERPARQLQASILLKLYARATQRGYSAQQAFIATYEVYSNIYGRARGQLQTQRLVDPERALYLVKRSGDFGTLGAPGVGEPVAMQACRSCGLEVLGAVREASFICPHCKSGS